jgi:hypothetical protein
MDNVLVVSYNPSMSEKKPKLTIDTNVINAKQALPAMNKLEQWRDEGKLEIVGAYRLKREIAEYKNQKAKEKEAKIPNVSEPIITVENKISLMYN